jgi:hypothetical protein
MDEFDTYRQPMHGTTDSGSLPSSEQFLRQSSIKVLEYYRLQKLLIAMSCTGKGMVAEFRGRIMMSCMVTRAPFSRKCLSSMHLWINLVKPVKKKVQAYHMLVQSREQA